MCRTIPSCVVLTCAMLCGPTQTWLDREVAEIRNRGTPAGASQMAESDEQKVARIKAMNSSDIRKIRVSAMLIYKTCYASS